MKNIGYINDIFMHLKVFEELLSNKLNVYTAISSQEALIATKLQNSCIEKGER